MKSGKKTTAMLAFVIGAAIFATTAVADVAIGSGYHNLKNAVKETVARLTDEVDNFTTEMNCEISVDGRVISGEALSAKMDVANNREESNRQDLQIDGTTSSYYSYNDNEKTVYKNDNDEKYRVYYSDKTYDYKIIENPFEEKLVQDAEKVLDAFVGSLKDVIQMEEAEGKKMYIGNLTETQVPTLVNALTSFVVKYSIMDEYTMKKNNCQ